MGLAAVTEREYMYKCRSKGGHCEASNFPDLEIDYRARHGPNNQRDFWRLFDYYEQFKNLYVIVPAGHCPSKVANQSTYSPLLLVFLSL